MKTLFLFRDCYDAKFILSKINLGNKLQAVILETGKDAKLRKLQRIFAGARIFHYPIIILNIFSLIIYSLWIEKKMAERLGNFIYPLDRIKLVVNDMNDQRVIKFIEDYQPDLIFIYGTAILRKEFFKKVKAAILNIHGGILPFYRNVHGDFWAYKQKDYRNLGVSLFYLDLGIDSGDIAQQKRISYKKNDSLIDVKVKLLSLIPSLVNLMVDNYHQHNLNRIKQDRSKAVYYKTPSFKDIFELLKNHIFGVRP